MDTPDGNALHSSPEHARATGRVVHRARVASTLLFVSISRYATQLFILYLVIASGSTVDVALFVRWIAITGPIFVVSSLGLRTLILTHEREISVRRYLVVRTVTTTPIVIAIAAIASLFGTETWAIAVGVTLMKAAELLVDVCTAYLQSVRRFGILTALSLSQTLGGVGSATIATLTGAPPYVVVLVAGLVSALLGVLACIAMLALAPSSSGPPQQTLRTDMYRALRAGLPLGISYGVVTLMTAVPQYVISLVGTADQSALLGVLIYFTQAADLISNPVAQSWISRGRELQRSGRLNRRTVLLTSSLSSALLAPVFVLGLVSGRIVIGLVFGDQYQPSLPEAIALFAIMATVPYVYMGESALAIKNLYGTSLIVNIPGVLVVFVVCLLLVPSMGVLGGLIALFLGALTRAASPYRVLRGSAGTVREVVET